MTDRGELWRGGWKRPCPPPSVHLVLWPTPPLAGVPPRASVVPAASWTGDGCGCSEGASVRERESVRVCAERFRWWCVECRAVVRCPATLLSPSAAQMRAFCPLTRPALPPLPTLTNYPPSLRARFPHFTSPLLPRSSLLPLLSHSTANNPSVSRLPSTFPPKPFSFVLALLSFNSLLVLHFTPSLCPPRPYVLSRRCLAIKIKEKGNCGSAAR